MSNTIIVSVFNELAPSVRTILQREENKGVEPVCMVGMVCGERSSESNRKKKKRRLPHPCTTRKSGAPTERNRRQNPNGCPTRLSLSAPGHSANRALLLSQALFWDEFCAFITYSTPAVVCRALPHSLGASRRRTFPQLNLHHACPN